MKLKLIVKPPANGTTFRPSEPVQGCIEVHNKKRPSANTVPNIRITFKGTTRVVLKPGFDAASQVAGTYRKEKCQVRMIHVLFDI